MLDRGTGKSVRESVTLPESDKRHLIHMDEGARRWLYKTAHHNYWRVATYIDLDDLIQDGYMHYVRLVRKYDRVRSRAQIMSLFKLVFMNHLADISNERSRDPEQVLHSDLSVERGEEDLVWDRVLSVVDEDLVFMAEAPDMVRDLLIALSKDNAWSRLKSAYRFRRDGTRETLNDRLCALVGYGKAGQYDRSKPDLVGQLYSYLKGDDEVHV